MVITVLVLEQQPRQRAVLVPVVGKQSKTNHFTVTLTESS